MQPAFDDAVDNRFWGVQRHDPDAFNRHDDPPAATLLRLLVEDDWREYAIPKAYEFREALGGGDFYAIKTGLPLHNTIAVRSWTLRSEAQ